MRIYVVTEAVHRSDGDIHDVVGIYSSLHNAHVAINQDMKADSVNTDLISIDKNGYCIDVPKEATDSWIHPHTYYISSYVLDCDIDEDDDANDDD